MAWHVQMLLCMMSCESSQMGGSPCGHKDACLPTSYMVNYLDVFTAICQLDMSDCGCSDRAMCYTIAIYAGVRHSLMPEPSQELCKVLCHACLKGFYECSHDIVCSCRLAAVPAHSPIVKACSKDGDMCLFCLCFTAICPSAT